MLANSYGLEGSDPETKRNVLIMTDGEFNLPVSKRCKAELCLQLFIHISTYEHFNSFKLLGAQTSKLTRLVTYRSKCHMGTAEFVVMA